MSWFREVREHWLQLVTNLLFALCIIALPAYTDTGKNAFYLLALLSLFYLFTNLDQLKQLDKVLKFFFIVVVLYFLWAVLTFYINGSPPGRGKGFIWSRQVFLLFIPSLYLLFRAAKIPFYVVWPSVLLSVILAAYVGYQDTLVGAGRAKGGTNHWILFGSILLCEAFYLLVVAIKSKQIWIRTVSLAGFSLATLVVIWSQSRGVWAAYPVLLVIVAAMVLKRYRVGVRILSLALLMGIISMSWLHPMVKERINTTVKSLDVYMSQDDVNHWSRQTSLGTRLEMWRAGWQIFLENPVFGVGIGAYDAAAKEGQERFNVNTSAYSHYHPHNQYISELSTKGLPGFILLICLLALPVTYAFVRKHGWRDNQLSATIIYVTCLAYVIFGLSDVPLEGKATIVFYVVFIAWLLSEIDRDSGKKRLEERTE